MGMRFRPVVACQMATMQHIPRDSEYLIWLGVRSTKMACKQHGKSYGLEISRYNLQWESGVATPMARDVTVERHEMPNTTADSPKSPIVRSFDQLRFGIGQKTATNVIDEDPSDMSVGLSTTESNGMPLP